MLTVNSISGFGGQIVGPVSVINRSAININSTGTDPYTHSAMAIGTASPTRRVLAAVVVEAPFTGGITISSLTIGGITATADVTVTDTTGANTQISAIYSATVPTGTTADVVMDFSAAPSRAAVVLHAIDNLVSTTPAATLTSNGVDPATGTIEHRGDGYLLAVATTTGTTSFTWTGPTERIDTTYGSSTSTVTVADLSPTVTAYGQTVTADAATKGARMSMVVASYR